jgi:hypothetical protein
MSTNGSLPCPAIGHQKIELLVVDQRIAEQQQAKHQRQAEILEKQPQGHLACLIHRGG